MEPGQNPYTPPSANLTNHGPYAGSAETAITARVVELLARTKGWVRFIGVLFFISAAIIMIVTLGAFALVSRLGGVGFLIVLIYGAMAGFYLYGGLKLNGYASSITRLIYSGKVSDLEEALDQQRAFWKFAGVMILIGILLFIMAFLGGALTAVRASQFDQF